MSDKPDPGNALNVMHRVIEGTMQNGPDRDTLRRAYQCVKNALLENIPKAGDCVDCGNDGEDKGSGGH